MSHVQGVCDVCQCLVREAMLLCLCMHTLCAHCYTNHTTSHHLHDSSEEVLVLTLQTLQLLAQHVCAAEWQQQQQQREHDAFEFTTLIVQACVIAAQTPWRGSSSRRTSSKTTNSPMALFLTPRAAWAMTRDPSRPSMAVFAGCAA